MTVMKKRTLSFLTLAAAGMLLLPPAVSHAGTMQTDEARKTAYTASQRQAHRKHTQARRLSARTSGEKDRSEMEPSGLLATSPTAFPSIDEIRLHGYPVNENGETYGPLLPEALEPEDAPDLLLVQNEDGVCGYVRESEMSGPRTREEMLQYAAAPYPIYADMYLQDGITVIGRFFCGS